MACFPDNFKATILLDFVFDLSASNERLSTTYKESIDKLLENESSTAKSENLTYEKALERILKANRHIDELSGKILLERSLTYENECLEFSRDPGVPKYFPIRFHLSQFMSMRECIGKNVNTPILHIYVYPYAYGEKTFSFVVEMLEAIRASSRKKLEHIQFDESDSHHFHMRRPSSVAKLILRFLNEEHAKCESKL